MTSIVRSNRPLWVALAGLGLAAAVLYSFAPWFAPRFAEAPPPFASWEMRVCADPNRMPFSHIDETGFENRIARIVAEQLNATLVYEWWPQSESMVVDYLRIGQCDVMMGIPDGASGLTSSLAYYRSPFVFAQRADRSPIIDNFDDPILPTLRIGVQPADGPTHNALETRGLGAKIMRIYETELRGPIDDVVKGDLDIVILWGPAAGYYARLQREVPIVLAPVTPEFEPPFIPMYINMVIGVRRGDEALRDLFDIAIAERWDDIQTVLEEFHLPLMPLAAPLLTVGGP